MNKQCKITNTEGKTVNVTIKPKVEGYDELVKKCDELSNKWQEIKQLVEEVEKMELPVNFYQSL